MLTKDIWNLGIQEMICELGDFRERGGTAPIPQFAIPQLAMDIKLLPGF